MKKFGEKKPPLLICDDDKLFHLAVKQCLKSAFECVSAFDCDEALVILKNQSIEVMLLDVQIRTHDEGLRYLPKFKEMEPFLSIVMSSGRTDFETVKEAMKLGASDYVAKDFNPDELTLVVTRILEQRQLIQRKNQQDYELNAEQKQRDLIGKSKSIEILRRNIEKMRVGQGNVLITGETGSGKEIVARQFRKRNSDGSLCPFVAVDSATIQSTMAESILFGHEKGAFTGADSTRKGVFEEAHGGYVYFDELANMPLEIQAKLLRVLQEKEVCRLGSRKPIELEFRVIGATNKNLEEMSRKGLFKEDLLQRLNVLPIEIPPLRDRKEDIPFLVDHFLSRNSGKTKDLKFTREALDLLNRYDWPGNVRELESTIAFAVTMTEGDEVDIADLPPKYRNARPPNSGSFYDQVSSFEKKILDDSYRSFDGNVSKMAVQLEMDRSHLYTKLKEYGIHTPKRS